MNVYAVVSGCWWARSCSSAGMDDSITGIALPFRQAVVSSHRIVLPVGPQTPRALPAMRPVEAAPCRKVPHEVGAGGAEKIGQRLHGFRDPTLTTMRLGIGTTLVR